MFAGIALSSAVALAALTSCVSAHGYLEQPKPSWKDSPNPGWVALVDNYWDIGSGGDQCGAFKTMAAQMGMSVKDVVLDMVKGQSCGNAVETGAAQPIPSDGKAKWLGNGGGGFTHVGPCEIYLDDKMVLHGDNCEEEYKGGGVGSTETSDMPVDYSSCNGKCTLSIYWLAFQNAQWQAYVNCVPLSGSGGSATKTEGSQSTETSTTQGSSAGKENGKSSKGETPSTEQQSTQTPSTEQKSTESPSSEQLSPSTEQKTTEAPSSENQSTQPPSSEQKTTQAPSSEQQWTQAHWTQAPSSEQQAPSPEQKTTQAPSSQLQSTPAPWTQAPSSEQQQTQAPSSQQQQTQAPSSQQQQQQQTQAPSTEQRSSVNFNNLNGGTGTVQPSTNLRN